MERHITDRPKKRDDSERLPAYLKVEREEGRHPAYDALHRQPKGERSDEVVKQYTRIERGETS